MKYLIDSADLALIKELDQIYPIAGVTTNPSILAQTGKSVSQILPALREQMGERMLHVQTLALEAVEIVREAKAICSLTDKDTYIKVPVNPQGLKAIRLLKEADYKVTATAICSAQQAVLAAACGADFVVPYVNRIADLNIDPFAVVRDLQRILELNACPTEILIASLKNVAQIQACMLAGAKAFTLPPACFAALASHQRSESSIVQFRQDWVKAGLSFPGLPSAPSPTHCLTHGPSCNATADDKPSEQA